MIRLFTRTLGTLAIAASAWPAAAQVTWWGGQSSGAYLSQADIPVGFYQGGSPTLLEDFEDNALDASLTASAGSIISFAQWGTLVDSIDADDGSIDGLGQRGRPWYLPDSSVGVTFTYVGNGPLPTAFAMAWTDGGVGDYTLEAFDSNGLSLGSNVFAGLGDNTFAGTTGEDRFLGVTYAGGIKAIKIRGIGGLEVDHIQYGQMHAPVPEPGTWALMALGLAAVGGLARQRRPRA